MWYCQNPGIPSANPECAILPKLLQFMLVSNISLLNNGIPLSSHAKSAHWQMNEQNLYHFVFKWMFFAFLMASILPGDMRNAVFGNILSILPAQTITLVGTLNLKIEILTKIL